MRSGHGRNVSKLWLLVALGIFAMMLASVSGCGGKKDEVETDPTIAEPAEAVDTETVPEAEVPEVEPEQGTALPDYAALEPSEFGVEDVFFAFDQYDLSSEAMSALSRNARIIRNAGDIVILIEGHADERGTIEYNLALGERRALAVKDYLTSLGVPSWQLQVTSYGESRPFALGSNDEAWALNRRAHFARP